MAMGAYLAIKETGLRIPQDVAVVGFDNIPTSKLGCWDVVESYDSIPTSKLVSPPLTTIDQFQHEVGQRAAEMLFERLNGMESSEGRSEEQPHQLIIRDST